MCGIAGIVRTKPFDAAAAVERTARVRRMAERLAHRGPDGLGVQVGDHAVLAHRRLAIHDPSPAGLQPFVSPDGRFVVVANGTFHNAPDLRAREALRGASFRSRSDTEVLLPLFARAGIDAVRELRGPFALAILDTVERRLVLARDRLGEKPLFYCRRGDELAFASELLALREAADEVRLDADAVPGFLQAGYVPGAATILAGFHELPPATILVFDANGLRLHEYWRPPIATEGARESRRAAEQVKEVLREAVFLRAHTDRRPGVFLSGGLDSTSVLLLAKDVLGEPPPTFTLGFDDPAFDERPAAALAAKALGARAISARFDVEPGPLLARLVGTTGEPLADPSWLAFSRLAEIAAPSATVFLSGDGGDELLLGYRRHAIARLSSPRLPLLRRLGPLLAPLLPDSRPRAALASLREGPLAVLADLVGLLPRRRLRREIPGFPGIDPLLASFARLGPLPADPGLAAAHADLGSYLPKDLLAKADRGAMSAGVEVWSPFLDHVVVETILGLPPETRRGLRRSKLPLRALLASRVPRELLARRKRGFGVPLLRWLRAGRYGRFAEETLAGSGGVLHALFGADRGRAFLRRVREGEDALAPLVHALVVLALVEATLVPPRPA